MEQMSLLLIRIKNIILLKKLNVIDTSEIKGMLFNGPDRRCWKISCSPDVVIHCDSEQVIYPVV